LLSVTDYLNANKFAVDNGGWLWSVNSAQEMNFVIDAFLPARAQYLAAFQTPAGFNGTPDGNFYIGFNDSEYFGASEGNFQWINGDPVTYTNWANGEPNNVGTDADPNGEDYAEIWELEGARTWNDDNDRGSGLNGLPRTGRLPAGGNMAVVEFAPLPPPAHLEVDPATGFARIVSDLTTPITLFSYDVTSTTSSLTWSDWATTNLSARGVDAAGSGIGQRWEELLSTSQSVLEGFLLGGSVLSPGEALVLGKIVAPFTAGVNEPAIKFNIATSNRNPSIPGSVATLDVPIQFNSFSVAVTGDYNRDGVVNAADYTVWRDALGTSGVGLPADGDNSGSVTQADYTVWATNYGAALSSSSAAAVPEPTSAVSVLVAGLILGSGARDVVRRP
jgi:hypothetical protein